MAERHLFKSITDYSWLGNHNVQETKEYIFNVIKNLNLPILKAIKGVTVGSLFLLQKQQLQVELPGHSKGKLDR